MKTIHSATESVTQKNNNFDAVVIGGGIIGCACAAALASEKLSVALIEGKFIGAGTTSDAMGHIVVMDDSDAQIALTKYSQFLWKQFAETLPPKCEFEQTGTIWIAADEAELAESYRKKVLFAQQQIVSEILDEKQLRDAEPNLREGLAGGLRVQDDAVIYPPTAAEYLASIATKRGARVIENTFVNAIEGDRILLSNGEQFSAKIIVNAAGCAAPRLSPELAITKRKGHLLISERAPGFINHQLIELGYIKNAHQHDKSSVAFNAQPRKTGQILIGSTRQFGSDDSAIDFQIVGEMLNRATDFLPTLASLSAVRLWTGFRPCTYDNLPFIGKSIENEQIIIAAGHEGLGITTALATAALVADIVFERPSKIDRTPFSPSRALA